MSTNIEAGSQQQLKPKSFASTAWREFKKNKGAIVGLSLVIFFVFVAIFAPLLAPHDPENMNQEFRLQGPSRHFVFGTDEHGRDILSRIIYGSRISISVGFVAVFIAGIGGITLGLVAGYWNKADSFIMRIIDVLMSFPFLLLAIGIVSILGPSLVNTMIAVGLGSIPGYARVTRSAVLKVREEEFIEATRALGFSDRRIIMRHILPNITAPIIVMCTLSLGSSILGAAALSFLGLGAKPPEPEWGFMLFSARSYINSAWWYSLFPGLAIMLMVLGFNMLGDGLRDALDPRLQNIK